MRKQKFKVGDRVRYISKESRHIPFGTIGTVLRVGTRDCIISVPVKFWSLGEWIAHFKNVELIDSQLEFEFMYE